MRSSSHRWARRPRDLAHRGNRADARRRPRSELDSAAVVDPVADGASRCRGGPRPGRAALSARDAEARCDGLRRVPRRVEGPRDKAVATRRQRPSAEGSRQAHSVGTAAATSRTSPMRLTAEDREPHRCPSAQLKVTLTRSVRATARSPLRTGGTTRWYSPTSPKRLLPAPLLGVRGSSHRRCPSRSRDVAGRRRRRRLRRFRSAAGNPPCGIDELAARRGVACTARAAPDQVVTLSAEGSGRCPLLQAVDDVVRERPVPSGRR